MSKELIIKGVRLSSDRACICVPVVASTVDSVINKVNNAAKAGVSMIELRADFFDFLYDTKTLEDLLSQVKSISDKMVVLFTIRTSKEGGEIDISKDDYKAVLKIVAASHCVDLIDVEGAFLKDAASFVAGLQAEGVYVIASHHNFNKTPEILDICEQYDRLHDTGADILKIAMMPHSMDDVMRVMKSSLLAKKAYQDSLFVTIAMGDYGKITRVAGSQVGSCITFAALEEASAPGQIGYKDLKTVLDILEF